MGVKSLKVLIIEDDIKLNKTLENALKMEGYEVESCFDGETGLYYFKANSSDLVILDWMLPEKSGLEILKIARDSGIMTPVLMLTALSSINNKVQGFDAGADDYLAKPFDMRELLARVKANIRRPITIESNGEIVFGDLTYQPMSLLLKCGSKEVVVSKHLGAMIELFIKSGNFTIARQTIFARVWGMESNVEEAIIESYVSFFRRRLRFINSTVQVKTIRGIGYALNGGQADA